MKPNFGNLLRLTAWYQCRQLSELVTQIESIISKVSDKVGLLYDISRFLPSFHLKCIYTVVVQSCFDYAITIWGSCYKTCLLPVQCVQNR